jgi:putative component of membrane protein insertase Oxa1/YidC/SpoIIIJ protein YidD
VKHHYLHCTKKWCSLVAASTYAVARQLLGPAYVCIYPVTCPDYARAMLTHKPFYVSIPLIALRLLSCNPLTALIRHVHYKTFCSVHGSIHPISPEATSGTHHERIKTPFTPPTPQVASTGRPECIARPPKLSKAKAERANVKK